MNINLNELNRMRCSSHGQVPKITKSVNGISVTSCCDAFSKKVIDKYGELLQKEAVNTISKAFKKFGR